MVVFFKKTLFISIVVILIVGCNQANKVVLYESDTLKIEQLNKNVFTHESKLGKVNCNGAIFRSDDEVVILDTPTSDFASHELIKWVAEELEAKIVAVIPTHFHVDCLGGIDSFNKMGVKSYAHSKTIELAKDDSVFLRSIPFESQIEFEFGNSKCVVSFFGKGHTHDNVVAYYSKEKTLFGGCLVKSIGADKGYLGVADTLSWSNTIRNISSTYPNVELVIPGHGEPGNSSLLDYTATMFEAAGTQ